VAGTKAPSSLRDTLTKMNRGPTILTPQIERYLSENSHMVLTEALVAEAVLPTILRDDNGSAGRVGRFGASSRGTCLRRQLFQYLGAPTTSDEPDTQLHNIFIDGTWRHIRWQALLRLIGAIEDVELKGSLPSRRLKVSLDGAGHYEGLRFGLEIKGMNWRSFATLEEGLPDKHQMQIETCFEAIPEIEFFVYLAEDKNTQEYREFVIERGAMPEYIAEAVRDELDVLNAHASMGSLPAVLDECKTTRSKKRKDCPYGSICRTATPEDFDYSVGDWAEVEVKVSRGRRKLTAHG
jgi:hypothetical protein